MNYSSKAQILRARLNLVRLFGPTSIF